MSVINSVLKDLETRKSRFTPVEIQSTSAPAAPVRDPKNWLLGALLLFGFAFAAWLLLQSRAAPEIAQQTPLSESTAPAPKIATPLPVTVSVVVPGNRIVGLQIRESESEMRLEFALQEKVVAYLKERGENSFGYHLRNIDSAIVAPVIADNPWIIDLEIISEQDGVDILLQTVPDILLETRQHRVDGEPIWSINLRQATPSVAVEPAATAPDIEVAALPKEIAVAPQPVPVQQKTAPSVAVEAKQAADPAPVKLEIKSTNPNAGSANQLEYAVELINSRRYGDAETLLRGLLDGQQDYNARQHLLALYARQKLNGRLLGFARESMQQYPADVVFRTEYARALFQQAAYRDVIELLRETPELDAGQHTLLAASYQRLDQHDSAVKYYRLALAQDANNAKNWIGLGISQEHSSALADALHSYQTAGRLGNLNSRLQAFVAKRTDTLQRVLN